MSEAAAGTARQGPGGGRPGVYTIPPHDAFADALAEGLLNGRPVSIETRLDLARAVVLLPNRRAVRAVRDAFVRKSGGALLLPRLSVLGDPEADPADFGLGEAGDALSEAEPVAALPRALMLSALVERWQEKTGKDRAKVETYRLAQELGRTLDTLQLWEVDPRTLEALPGADLATHWQQTAEFLAIVSDRWPEVLDARGEVDRVRQRTVRLAALSQRWADTPPRGAVIAAGIANADPAAAALLSTIARLPRGAVVLPSLDKAMATESWDRLSPSSPHPQVPLKLLLDAMSVSRAEVSDWSPDGASEHSGGAARTVVLTEALAAPSDTAAWTPLPMDHNGALGLSFAEAASPAEEAMIIALAFRRALDTDGKTAALVTPDRDLARRVAVQMTRWGVAVDDSAGRPLSLSPPGVFLRLALEAAQSRFAPAPLLALLKHPLAGPDTEARGDWLATVRRIDQLLRGVRPARGLQGIRNRITKTLDRDDPDRESIIEWWKAREVELRPLAALFQRRKTASIAESVAVLRAYLEAASGERFWDGQAGRAAADLIADLEREGDAGGTVGADDLPALMSAIMAELAVRPVFGTHPRLSIYGLLEARLQRTDLMILGGLNEGSWPRDDGFDPWLPPRIRAELDLPPLERAQSLAALDFLAAAAAPEVLLTRSKKADGAPAVASRYWLRVKARLGAAAKHDTQLERLAAAFDGFEKEPPAPRPEPSPPIKDRPTKISVTQVETLRADPYQFYARKMLGLEPLEGLGEDAGAAERGTIVHEILERLTEAQDLNDAAARAEALDKALKDYADHPLTQVLWRPRVARMLDWAAAQVAEAATLGMTVAAAERKGRLTEAGVTLTGKADLILSGRDGYTVVDYKTGAPPSTGRIVDGYADQLALLAWLVEAGAVDTVEAGPVAQIAYWRLSGGMTEGEIRASGRHNKAAWDDLPTYFDAAKARFRQVVGQYLTGGAAFTARLRPEYAPWNDYDQLARVAEWEGRSRE
ncbi:MAG: double-strand break repair protein AddB [Pacificimonas sp.]|jgi:ATP-dependent helicase/nuclease subunit B|nr:double-strand break repair protein AddB [Pacificimonas sp.]